MTRDEILRRVVVLADHKPTVGFILDVLEAAGLIDGEAGSPPGGGEPVVDLAQELLDEERAELAAAFDACGWGGAITQAGFVRALGASHKTHQEINEVAVEHGCGEGETVVGFIRRLAWRVAWGREVLDTAEECGWKPADEKLADFIRRLAEERDELIEAAKSAIPEAEHPTSGSADDWAWQIRNLGEDRRAAYRARDEAMRLANKETAQIEALKDLTLGLWRLQSEQLPDYVRRMAREWDEAERRATKLQAELSEAHRERDEAVARSRQEARDRQAAELRAKLAARDYAEEPEIAGPEEAPDYEQIRQAYEEGYQDAEGADEGEGDCWYDSAARATALAARPFRHEPGDGPASSEPTTYTLTAKQAKDVTVEDLVIVGELAGPAKVSHIWRGPHVLVRAHEIEFTRSPDDLVLVVVPSAGK
jgi:hypothetical protein